MITLHGLYIRFIPSCCICNVFHSVFSVYVHLMYIFLSLFSVDGFYCTLLLDIVLICCCTPEFFCPIYEVLHTTNLIEISSSKFGRTCSEKRYGYYIPSERPC